MEVTTLKAEPRTARGSNQIARLRENGIVPAIVYGSGGESKSVSLAEVDVERELRHHHRVFRIECEGNTEGVFLQDVQFDVITDQALHLDFRRIDLDKPIRVDVELFYVGHAKGASKGGELIKDCFTVEVDSLPAAVPENIEVAVGEIDLGDTIHLKDLTLPPGVSIPEGSGDLVVCHMPAHAKLEEEPVAGEDGAEGADAGDGDGAGDGDSGTES